METDRMALRQARRRECVLGEYPRFLRNAALRRQCLLAADGDTPESAVHRVRRAERWNRQAMIFEGPGLFRPLACPIPIRRVDFEGRRIAAKLQFTAVLI